MSDQQFRKQAERLIEAVSDLQKQVLLKHTTGMLAAIYEERELLKNKLAEKGAALKRAEAHAADRDSATQGMANWKATAEAKDRQIAAERDRAEKAEAERDAAKAPLASLYAMVMGECPSLLDEDSGGSAIYDIARTLEMERNGLAARVAELEPDAERLNVALVNLFAMVNGEVPSLLEDDHHYGLIVDALEKHAARSKP